MTVGRYGKGFEGTHLFHSDVLHKDVKSGYKTVGLEWLKLHGKRVVSLIRILLAG